MIENLQVPGIARVLLAIFICSTAVIGQTSGRKVAVTFDDLPYVGLGQLDYLAHAQSATAKIIRVLQKYHVPVIAFVNEQKLQRTGEMDARIALLQQWIDAGAILGNHTYSHPDANKLSIEQFEDEIIKGEVITRRLMLSHQPYQLYFRHPQTHTGDTQAKKEAIEKSLAAGGYKVAPHTLDGSDYIFNALYVDALRQNDQAKPSASAKLIWISQLRRRSLPNAYHHVSSAAKLRRRF